MKTRCLQHHPDDFSCRFRLYTPLISAVNPFLAHLYLPVCILWLPSIITHPTAALSLHVDVTPPTPRNRLVPNRLWQAIAALPLEVASAPAWSLGWSNHMSWFSCVDRRCCTHCFCPLSWCLYGNSLWQIKFTVLLSLFAIFIEEGWD